MTSSVNTKLEGAIKLRDSSSSWKLDAELLLANAMNSNRANLLARPEQELTSEQEVLFEKALERRLQGEPVAYILGKKGFWDFELSVDKRVLIPRPETELLVERALICLEGREEEELELADLGTGSGAIAIALAKHSNNWRVTATDISTDALDLARANADSLNLKNIQFLKSSWCEQLYDNKFDIVVSNPPYVAPEDPHLQQDGLNFEPTLALVAEGTGLAELSKIAQQTPIHFKENAWLLLEHSFQQASSVAALLEQNGFTEISCWQDLAGLDRVTSAQISVDI